MKNGRHEAPLHVQQLARRRAEARHERDYQIADRLKSEIEEAGWKVVDYGPDYSLEPVRPPDTEADGVIRYGSSVSVPSRLDEPDEQSATLVAVDLLPPDAHGQAQVVTVMTDPAAVPLRPVFGAELVLSSTQLGLAAAWNIGLRRAVGALVILFAPGITPTHDIVEPLLEALRDDSVGVAGSDGLISSDMRRWQSAGPGEVDALDARVIAFRRRDARQRGPLDERFATARLLATWWSLVLRDEGADRRSRRALALDLDLQSEGRQSTARVEDDAQARQARRDFYRLVDRFGRRVDLLGEPIRPTAASAKARRPRL
ncbi:hypothetical protein BH24CHL6_BH24CHL6_15270 [soil metagenome]